MKRGRVQAQRKFAQGAAIPPTTHTNNNNVERIRKDDIGSVTTFHNKMSATTLLDAISFKNLHLHLQNKELEPVVRLERIESKTGARIFSNKILKKAKLKNRKRQTQKLIVNKKMLRITRSTSSLIKGKRPDADDIDDDTPLKFLRNFTFDTKRSPPQQENREKIKRDIKLSPLQQGNKEKIRRGRKQKSTRSSHDVSVVTQNKNDVNRDAVGAKTKRTRSSLESSPINGKDNNTNGLGLKPKRTRSNHDVKSVNENKNGDSDDVGIKRPRVRCVGNAKINTLEKPAGDQISTTEGNSMIQNGVDDADRKRSARRFINIKTKKCNKQSSVGAEGKRKIKKSLKEDLEIKIKLRLRNSTGISKNKNIDTHVSSEVLTSEERRPEDHEISTEVPTAQPDVLEAPSDVLPGTSSSTEGHSSAHIQCPSSKYATVKEVMDAPLCDLKGLCHNCSQCSRVDKVVEIARLVEAPIDSDSEIELHYSDEEQTATTSEPMESQQESLTNVPENAGEGTSRDVGTEMPPDNDASYLYLDILPPTADSVIQIKLSRIPDEEKLITARLIPKSATSGENEFNLIEHENLLDQLLVALNINRSSGDNETSTANNTTDTSTANNPEDSPDVIEVDITTDTSDIENTTVINDENTTVTDPVETSDVNMGQNITDMLGEQERNLHVEVSIQSMTDDSESKPHPDNPSLNLDYCIPSTSNDDRHIKSEIPTTDSKTRQVDVQASNRNKAGFPKTLNRAKLLDAPVYYPTAAEFNDPVAYFEKIMPKASKFGICKVVAPSSFNPKCTINDNIRFNVSNQYIARLYSRWGLASKEMCAIKAYLASQSVHFTRAPFLDGLEVDLPKLYRTVQKHGGLNNVIEKKRWARVAEEMRIAKGPKAENKLDTIYVRYLLPYDTLSNHEREQIAMAVTKAWHKRNQKIQDRALNPLHRQKQLLGESETSEDDTEEESDVASALTEAEDCVVTGRRMTLSTFKKAAEVAAETYFPTNSCPPPDEVETEYWRVVLHGTDHVCVYTASIDTGEEGYGFPKNKADQYAKHPWNLKMISQNSGNVLRSLGSVLGVTVPTLHVGMMFSTSCWHRDPHGLPWIEYMHNGPAKIWYGIPDEQSDKFRHAVEVLCPSSCQNKSIWLPSDITMIPPHFLLDQGVSLSRVEQRPGEFIIVFPRAYSCSICTGYTHSESVYFATASWLKTVEQVFQELRDSCEPTMFPLERVLMSIARDSRSALCVLQAVHLTLSAVVEEELQRRRELLRLNVVLAPVPPAVARRTARLHRRRLAGAWNLRDQDECEVCRATLYLSKVVGLSDKTAVCLQHALQLHARRTSDRDVSLVLFYSDEELHELVSTLQRSFAPRD